MGSRGTIRFVMDGKTVEADGVAPTTTLLQYLREHLGRSGTKEGCAEGDCGACTVVEGQLCDGAMKYRAVNSCIRFLPTFDGREVVTVESLKSNAGELHPVQQAMVECHGSQCGFCTPGFVMSLFALYLNEAGPSREKIVESLSGNLCRCTGYRPIIEAAGKVDSYPAPACWSRDNAQSAAHLAPLKALARKDSLRIDAAPGFAAPRTLDELGTLYTERPNALLLAGGTDIGLWVTKQMRELPFIIYLGEVAELSEVRVTKDELEIGAAVNLSDAYAAIVARYPALAELADRFASVPIRNSGTFCGNVANGSPIGDSMPFLLALNASVVLRQGQSTRTLPLDKFYLAYQKKALAPAEFVASVRIPLPKANAEGRSIVASYKISKRFDQDISAVCGGYALQVVDNIIVTARIAYGGMAATPLRAAHAEAALTGQPWSAATFETARAAVAMDYQPIGDMRASAAYRLQIAGNLLTRLFLEHDGDGTAARIPAHLDATLAD